MGAGKSEAAASLRGLHAIRLARQDDHGSPIAERRDALLPLAELGPGQAILSSGYGTTRQRGAATVSVR